MSNFRICYPNAEGGVSVIVPADNSSIEEAIKAVPPLTEYTIIDAADLPQDRIFRNAWVHDASCGCKEDHAKCLTIAHEKRRAKRAEEFAPHDEIIAKQIPGKSQQAAEIARAAIRTKYDSIQVAMDAAANVAELKTIMAGL